MVIKHAVLFKAPLIDTGGDDGPVVYFCDQERLPLFIKGLLDPDLKGRAVRLCTDTEDISAETDGGACNALFHQKVLQAVGNIALGNGTEIQDRSVIGKGDPVSVKGNLLKSYMGQGLRKSGRIGGPQAFPR